MDDASRPRGTARESIEPLRGLFANHMHKCPAAEAVGVFRLDRCGKRTAIGAALLGTRSLRPPGLPVAGFVAGATLIETCKLIGSIRKPTSLTKLINLWRGSGLNDLMPWAWAAIMRASQTIDGSMTGKKFLAYVERCLAPTLKRKDIVMIDNLPAHKTAGVREAIEARGAMLRYLPKYSPDRKPTRGTAA